MSINSLHSVTKYSEELDKLFAQKSATGFFADNDFGKKFVGAKTVIVPDIDFQGLANYDREGGFARGAITVTNTSYTMSMDRARSLQIDREDMDETGIANLAGKILGEYVRTKVVPECDAYVLSKLSGIALSRGNTIKYTNGKPLEALNNLITSVRNVVGYDEELVAFVNARIYGILQNSTELSKMIISSDFKQGEVNLSVKSLNGVALIPVVGERMRSEFVFANDAEGGFKPAENSKEILMLVCPKKAAHLVRKTENMRIFTPEQNLDADAYKFDYRIYYDALVKKSELDSVWASFGAATTYTIDHPDAAVPPEYEMRVGVNVESDGEVSYQWYLGKENNFAKATALKGETGNYIEHTFHDIGEYYFFLKIELEGETSVVVGPMSVEVKEMI